MNAAAVISSVLAKSICVFVSFPLEYKATVLFGQKTFTTQVNKAVNKSFFTGFIPLYLNNVSLSVLFWPVCESTKLFLKTRVGVQKEGYLAPTSAFLSCLICGVLTYPFELLKTLKISYEDRYGGKSGLRILKDLYRAGGIESLTAGECHSNHLSGESKSVTIIFSDPKKSF